MSDLSEQSFFKDYTIELNKKIIDLKKNILNDLKNDNKLDNSDINYIDLDNKNEKVFKDFVKLSLNKGILPSSFDNYKFSDITVSDRTFIFIALQIINKSINLNNIPEKIFYNEKNTMENISKYSNNQNMNKYNNNQNMNKYRNKFNDDKDNSIEKNNNFVFNNNDFPPLK